MGGRPGSVAERLLRRLEPELNSGCWLWSGCGLASGYGTINTGGGKMDLAHRVSYRLFRGEIPEGHLVCHKCDTPACCNPAHLFVGSARDNTRDMMRKGRQWMRGVSGPRNGRTKLTAEQVREIAARSGSGPALAKEFGVSVSRVNQIRRGRRTAPGWLGITNGEMR